MPSSIALVFLSLCLARFLSHRLRLAILATNYLSAARPRILLVCCLRYYEERFYLEDSLRT